MALWSLSVRVEMGEFGRTPGAEKRDGGIDLDSLHREIVNFVSSVASDEPPANTV